MIRSLRASIRRNLPKAYVETFDGQRFTYEIPLTTYPKTYNGRPLCLAALASQRSYVTLYLMAVYGDQAVADWFRDIYRRSGKILRMGKSCVHFTSREDIPLDVVERAIAAVPVARYIEIVEQSRRAAGGSKLPGVRST